MLKMFNTRPPAYELVHGIIYVNLKSQDDKQHHIQ